MKAKLKKKFQKLLNVVMVVGILITSFPISPLIQNVHALSTVSGDKIIEVAQTYKSYTYGEVGTCTGLVTRVLKQPLSREQERLYQKEWDIYGNACSIRSG